MTPDRPKTRGAWDSQQSTVLTHVLTETASARSGKHQISQLLKAFRNLDCLQADRIPLELPFANEAVDVLASKGIVGPKAGGVRSEIKFVASLVTRFAGGPVSDFKWTPGQPLPTPIRLSAASKPIVPGFSLYSCLNECGFGLRFHTDEVSAHSTAAFMSFGPTHVAVKECVPMLTSP